MAKILFNEATKSSIFRMTGSVIFFVSWKMDSLGHQYFGRHFNDTGIHSAFHPDAYTEPHSVCVWQMIFSLP